jgi:carbon-monoxide dehydrogenase large subunit
MSQPEHDSLIGAPIARKEDRRLLLGNGRYVDDMNRPGQAFAHLVRSPHAHAIIRSIDASKAEAAPGVVAVYTGKDLAADKVGGLPCGWQIKNKDGTPMVEPPHPSLVLDRVRHVGDQVAVVIAETRAQAKAAAQLVEVDYEPLPAVAFVRDAVAEGAPQVWEQAAHNTCYDWHLGELAPVEAAFAAAHKIVEIEVVNNRLIPNAMEPRAAIGDYDFASDVITLYTTSQNPHLIRLLLGAFVLGVPEHKIRVVAPDVGGGFGSKIFHYAEEVLVVWASRKLRRPVKWTAERSESFMSDAHGRDTVMKAKLALDAEGHFLGLRVHNLANMGAYLSTFAPAVPTYLSATLLAGVYKTPAIYAEVRAVFTHTVAVDAYRGAGRPEAAYLLERLVDKAAREMGMDRIAIRRKNFITTFPYQTPVALAYDSGDYEATLALALKEIDYDGFPARREAAKKRGQLRGMGFSTYVETRWGWCGSTPRAR